MQPIVKVEGSSSVDGVGYDQATQTLAVRFRSGQVYQFPDVPPEVHRDFMASPSKGSFFHTNIRGKFTGTKEAEAEKAE